MHRTTEVHDDPDARSVDLGDRRQVQKEVDTVGAGQQRGPERTVRAVPQDQFSAAAQQRLIGVAKPDGLHTELGIHGNPLVYATVRGEPRSPGRGPRRPDRLPLKGLRVRAGDVALSP